MTEQEERETDYIIDVLHKRPDLQEELLTRLRERNVTAYGVVQYKLAQIKRVGRKATNAVSTEPGPV